MLALSTCTWSILQHALKVRTCSGLGKSTNGQRTLSTRTFMEASAVFVIHPLYWVSKYCNEQARILGGAAENKKWHPSHQIVQCNKKRSLRKETLSLKHNNPYAKPIFGGSRASPLGKIHFRKTHPQAQTDHSHSIFHDFH